MEADGPAQPRARPWRAVAAIRDGTARRVVPLAAAGAPAASRRWPAPGHRPGPRGTPPGRRPARPAAALAPGPQDRARGAVAQADPGFPAGPARASPLRGRGARRARAV